jgi:7-cyano-7-deazaguanine synthase
MIKSSEKALVVLSGGQDSVTCLGLALRDYEAVEAISFIYGQRHGTPEMECASYLTKRYNVPHKIVHMDFVKDLVTSALVGDGEVGLPHHYKPGLPSSFVPGRNAFFMVAAHAHAQEIKAGVIITGVCETDYSGYPDCRRTFISAMEEALNIGYETEIVILTPLMFIDKAATFALAAKANFLHEVIAHSHTCYNGVHDEEHSHDWGYGCGTCPACLLRKKGYEEFLAQTAAHTD